MEIHKRELDGKKVFISQRGDDNFRVIKPWRNEDGSFNWFNFLTGGSWTNLIIVAIVVIVTLGVLYEYSTNLKICAEVLGSRNITIIP